MLVVSVGALCGSIGWAAVESCGSAGQVCRLFSDGGVKEIVECLLSGGLLMLWEFFPGEVELALGGRGLGVGCCRFGADFAVWLRTLNGLLGAFLAGVVGGRPVGGGPLHELGRGVETEHRQHGGGLLHLCL